MKDSARDAHNKFEEKELQLNTSDDFNKSEEESNPKLFEELITATAFPAN